MLPTFANLLLVYVSKEFKKFSLLQGFRSKVLIDIGWLQDKGRWAGLKSLGMVESSREIKGKCSHEKRYYISSIECDAKNFGNAVRSHWGIENSVHWVLDIAFREDESRIRKGSAPENYFFTQP